MANWSKNKTLPANVNNGNEFLPTDGVYSGDMNAAFNNAFYAVDYATALADTPDTSEVGNVGTPSVSLIDNVKDGKAYKKFKFANLKGEKGQDGKNGVDGENGADGADGKPALAYGMSINLTTDAPTAAVSLPNQYFNRTPQLNDLFIAVGTSSVGSYQIVYKITSVGSPQSVATPQSYVTTTGKQITGGAALDGDNIFTGTNTFKKQTVFEQAPKSATYESATGTAMLHDTGAQIKAGQTTRSLLLRGNTERPKYTTNEENSEYAKEFAFTDDIPSVPDTTAILKAVYPVGSIYMSMSSANPSTWISGTTWEAWGSGRVPVGVDTSDASFDTVEKTGGEKTHTLTESEMPKHNHTGTQSIDADVYSQKDPTAITPSVQYERKRHTADFTTSTIETITAYEQGTRLATDLVKVNYGVEKGGDGAHNNLQPYITCYMWKRTV